jgi:hypothetical protein
MIKTLLVRLFQRSPLLRFLVLPVLFGIFILFVSAFTVIIHNRPVLQSLSPSVANPGELLVIQGRHFGKKQGDSWIEIAGNRISGNAFLKWTNTTIMLTVPLTVDDGLVYVVNRYGRSNPLVFANRNDIPVAARVNADLSLPVITSFDSTEIQTGKRVVISGKNFGISRNKSEVLFSWQKDQAIPRSGAQESLSSIACSDHDFDYELWSDQELRIRIPDGAESGNEYVKTERGLSNPMPIQIVDPAGTKTFTNRRTFIMSLQVDITDISASSGNMLYLHIPLPEISASQRSVDVTASEPKPFMDDFHGALLHQLENIRAGQNEHISHSILMTNYDLQTTINPALVKPWADVESPLYLMYTAPDRIIPSGTNEIVLTASTIAGKETNPYLEAKNIYSWLLSNITYTAQDKPDRPVLDALSSRTGDAYDMAILFTALARASGIPAIPVAGVIVDAQRNSRLHWWSEFYLENFGWVPVDPGLAAENKAGAATQGTTDPNFGNLDANHIAFSRGWTEVKPMSPKSRIVYKPRSWAFQPIWEESAGNIKGYTSFWSDPKITGFY